MQLLQTFLGRIGHAKKTFTHRTEDEDNGAAGISPLRPCNDGKRASLEAFLVISELKPATSAMPPFVQPANFDGSGHHA